MKIIRIISGLRTGGAEGVLKRFVIGDTSNSHAVVSLSDLGELGEDLQSHGISVFTLGIRKAPSTWRGLASLFRILRRERPDVVQTWMVHSDVIGGLVARLVGVPKVFWGVRHSNYPIRSTKPSTLFFVALASILSWFIPTKIISCAKSAVIEHKKMGFRADKFVVIPNGFIFQPVDPVSATEKKARWLPMKTPVIGCIARFHPQKDHQNLLKALGQLQEKGLDFQCLLVGPGMVESNKELVSWVRAQNLDSRITYLGNQSDLRDVFSRMRLNVLPSSSGEAFPNILVEAMASGVPCIATDVGDSRDILGELGWIVPPSNSKKLAIAIQTALLEQGRFYSKRVEKGQRVARSRYPLALMIDEYLLAYKGKVIHETT